MCEGVRVWHYSLLFPSLLQWEEPHSLIVPRRAVHGALPEVGHGLGEGVSRGAAHHLPRVKHSCTRVETVDCCKREGHTEW